MIDYATGDIAVTSNNWIEDKKYGWRVYRGAASVSAEFDSAVTRTGRFTLKLETTDATGTLIGGNVNVTPLTEAVSCEASTQYKLSCWVKTDNVAADAVFFFLTDYDASGVAGSSYTSSKLSGTNDWTLIELTFTTAADAALLRIQCRNFVAGNVGAAWFDVNSLTILKISPAPTRSPVV